MRRILVVSASVGAGHDGAARELDARLGARGFRVDHHDFLDLVPGGLGRSLSHAYERTLASAPTTWQSTYAALERSRALADVARTLSRIASSRTVTATRGGLAAVVSTYPLASQVLGHLRRRNQIGAPVCTYLTDLSVHRLWVAAGVDVHLALHPVAAVQAARNGARHVVATAPAIPETFSRPVTTRARLDTRRRHGLPPTGRLALLAAGSWGVGDVARAAREIAATGMTVPVVLCGHNRALRETVMRSGTGIALGWVDEMAGLMRASDVLVQNAGGLTSLEAFAAGLPVVTYRSLPGHGRTNAMALESAGLASWIRRPDELVGVLRDVLDGPLGTRQGHAAAALLSGADPAGVIADLVEYRSAVGQLAR